MQNAGALKVTTPSDREVQMTRVFNAPRRIVWQAMTKPEFLKQWLFGPPGWEMTRCDDDPRVGGAFTWAWRGPNGESFSMSGVYREVVVHERVVRTEKFDMGDCMPPMAEQIATLALSESGGKTTLTITVLFPSKEARDGAIASGMAQGVGAGYDRLEGLLAAGAIASA